MDPLVFFYLVKICLPAIYFSFSANKVADRIICERSDFMRAKQRCTLIIHMMMWVNPLSSQVVVVLNS
jgi:hypothetical protein